MESVFSRSGQLSEVNLDPDTLVDMVSIMINTVEYNPSLKDIMDKYYDMSKVPTHGGKNQTKKKDLFNSPNKSRPLGPGLGLRWVN